MAKLRLSTFPALLVLALQAGCAATPDRTYVVRSGLELPRSSCDTSVKYIHLAARLRNTTNGDIAFHLDGDRGPPFDPWYLGYRVHSSVPGGTFQLVHNSGHDSEWTRTVAIAPGNSAEFNVPIFGLRPADYLRHFRIELRDSRGRSYWTPPFELCAVARSNCDCPRPGGALPGLSQAPGRACPAATVALGASDATAVEVGVNCR